MTPVSKPITDHFEGPLVPAAWRAEGGGAVGLSARHFKSGGQSLHWTWENGSRLIRDGLALTPAEQPQAGMSGWVYCEKPVSGRLTFRLGTKAQLAAGTPAYQFRFGLEFTGWRRFLVQFEADAKRDAPGGDIEALVIAPPDGVPSGCVYLDAITIASSISGRRSADYQIPENPGPHLRHLQLTPTQPLPNQVTDAQRRDFATITKRLDRFFLAGCAQHEQYDQAIKQAKAGLAVDNIRRDDEGRVTGPALIDTRTQFCPVFNTRLLPLIIDYKVNGHDASKEQALLLFDYVGDQGWAEGSSPDGNLYFMSIHMGAFPFCVWMLRDELQASGRLAAQRAAQLWYSDFRGTFLGAGNELYAGAADILRGGGPLGQLCMMLTMEDSPAKVQYLKAWLDWLNGMLRVTPGYEGVFKPDGTGWHHRGIYTGCYCPESYEACALLVWLLSGTEFAVEPDSVATLAAALRTYDIISNRHTTPTATQGRYFGNDNTIPLAAYGYLALLSDPADPEMAGIFMRHYETMQDGPRGTGVAMPDPIFAINMHTLGRRHLLLELADRKLPAVPAPQGFWSKPWGALAVHRRDGWLVSVKGWSQYVWDFEMHPKCWAPVEENVFARFCSYGTLQPITHGEPANPVDSGWNLAKGWDWCRWPGATSPHLTLAENYDPKTTWASRFFSAATFVGGVSCEGRNGLFALKLHEHYYDPTFRAYKTYFFFDHEIICLGSNIESREESRAYGTTLFQSWMPEPGLPIQVNGEPVTAFPYEFRGVAGQPLTLLDPYGNGFFVPDSRDVRLVRGEQKSRDAWNRGETRGAFSTCWFDHGKPPKDDGYGSERYHYVQLVQTTPEALAAYAKAVPYRVLLQNHQAHIVEHFGQKTMAYALFETDWIIPHGLVRKTDTPVMVMVKDQGDGAVLSLADPDLRLPKRRNMAYLDEEAMATHSRPSQVRVELRGDWQPATSTSGIEVESRRNGVTALVFTCRDGATREVVLKGKAI